MDIKNLVIEEIKKMDLETLVKLEIQKSVKETIQSTIHNQFRSYSDFSGELEKHLREELKVNFKEIKLAEYRSIILGEIQNAVDSVLINSTKDLINEKIQSLLTGVKDEYELSEIIELFKKEYDEWAKNDKTEEISLHIDNEHSYFSSIYFDRKANVKNYSCEYKFFINKDNTIDCLRIKGYDFEDKAIYPFLLNNFDRTLLQIFTSGSKVINDIKEGDEDDYICYDWIDNREEEEDY